MISPSLPLPTVADLVPPPAPIKRKWVPLPQRLLISAVVAIPFLALIAAIILMWGWGIGWLELSLFAGMYLVTAIGITVGYHRLLTHRSFETTSTVRFILAALGSAAVEGNIANWVAMHRKHHQYSDEADDPHTPHHSGKGLFGFLRGFLHAHIGWAFYDGNNEIEKYAPDINKSRSLKLVNKLFVFWVALGLIIPTVIGGLVTGTWTGALLGFLWGGLIRIFFVHHVTWSVNSVCHIWGSRPYPVDRSTNNVLFGILAMGEGWHNNHHAFPTSARHGLRWWQFDASYIFIRGLQLVGLAWKIRVPSESTLAKHEA
ncbi:MAG: acyl-CoA desaturase [Zavarzinella sp.]